MSDSAQLPPAAVLLRYQVADFDAWKTVFDANEPKRVESGFLAHHVNRAEDDPNRLSVYFAVADRDEFQAYADSDEVKALMQKAGVNSQPEFMWVTPVREAVVWDRELPAMITSHQVEDFDVWLAGFDAGAGIRDQAGMVGEAVNRSVDDPSMVLVYLQAETFDALRGLARSSDLRTAMLESGVRSEPEFSYHTGGWGKRYQ